MKNLPNPAPHKCQVSVQFNSVAQSCLTLCDPMNCSTPGLPVHHQLPLPKPMSIELVMPSNHLILCHPLFLLPPIPPSLGVFSNESTLHMRWPKYWSFSFSISPSNEHPGLISFRMDLLDLLAVQGTLKSLLQHHSSKAINSSVLSFFFFFSLNIYGFYLTYISTYNIHTENTSGHQRTFISCIPSDDITHDFESYWMKDVPGSISHLSPQVVGDQSTLL